MLFASSYEGWDQLLEKWMHEASHARNYWTIWRYSFLSNLEALTIADVIAILVFMTTIIIFSVWLILKLKIKDDYLDGWHDGAYDSIASRVKMRYGPGSSFIVVVVSDTEYRNAVDQIVCARYNGSRIVLHNDSPKTENECHTGTIYTSHIFFSEYYFLRLLRFILGGASVSTNQGSELESSTMTSSQQTQSSESNKKEPME